MNSFLILLVVTLVCFAYDHDTEKSIKRRTLSFTYSANEFDFFNSSNQAVQLASSDTAGISPNTYQLYLNVPLRDIQTKKIIGLATYQEFITVRFGITVLDFTANFHFVDKSFPGGSDLIYVSSYSPQNEDFKGFLPTGLYSYLSTAGTGAYNLQSGVGRLINLNITDGGLRVVTIR